MQQIFNDVLGNLFLKNQTIKGNIEGWPKIKDLPLNTEQFYEIKYIEGAFLSKTHSEKKKNKIYLYLTLESLYKI